MQWNALHNDSSLFPPSTAPSKRQRPIEFQPTASTHQLQMQQEQGPHYTQQNAQRGDVLQAQQDQRPLPVHAPTSELSFAELPRHSAILRQQLLRLRDEVALLQVLSHDALHTSSIHSFCI
jgi:Na+-translocating ferredoxin:NAD+ oxidoreductase RnfC subunit